MAELVAVQLVPRALARCDVKGCDKPVHCARPVYVKPVPGMLERKARGWLVSSTTRSVLLPTEVMTCEAHQLAMLEMMWSGEIKERTVTPFQLPRAFGPSTNGTVP